MHVWFANHVFVAKQIWAQLSTPMILRRVLRNNSKIRFHQYCWCFRGSIPISVLHLSIDYLSQHDHQNSISQETKKNALTCGVSDLFYSKKKIFFSFVLHFMSRSWKSSDIILVSRIKLYFLWHLCQIKILISLCYPFQI